MNDEFLYQLREPPSKRFALRLKARLDVQSTTSASKRGAAKWYAIGSLLIGATALALFNPGLPTAVSSWVDHAPSETPAASVPKTLEAAPPTSSPAATLGPSPTTAAVSPPPASVTPTAASPLSLVKAFALGPTEVVADLIASFQETYGFEARSEPVLCLGARHADVALSIGPISESARGACESYGIRFIEVPIGYDAYVALVHRDNTWVKSLQLEDLRAIGRPSWDPLTTWNQVRHDWPSLPITVLGLTTREANPKFTTARDVRPLPFTISPDDARVPMLVDAAYGGLGLMTFATYERQVTDLQGRHMPMAARVIPLINARGDAVMPSRKTIQDGSYEVLSRPLYLYVSVKSLRRHHVMLFATHAIESFSQQLDRYGYTMIDKATMDASARQVRSAGRQ